jgi:hypothetical protein
MICSYCAFYGTMTKGTRAEVVEHAHEHPIGDPKDMARPNEEFTRWLAGGSLGLASQPFEHDRYRAHGGDVGGDNCRGDSPSRTFAQRRADGTWTVITEYASAYVANEYEFPVVYDVWNMTEIMHCRDMDDIGGTKIDCDYEYEFINYLAISTLRKAERLARKYIKSLDIFHYGWD